MLPFYSLQICNKFTNAYKSIPAKFYILNMENNAGTAVIETNYVEQD